MDLQCCLQVDSSPLESGIPEFLDRNCRWIDKKPQVPSDVLKICFFGPETAEPASRIVRLPSARRGPLKETVGE